MQELYREIILGRARHPHHSGVLTPCDIDHEEVNTLCGDYLHLTMCIDNNQRITDVAWEGEGCVISQASADLLGDHIIGKSLGEIKQITVNDMFNFLQIPVLPNRSKCATLALKALITAVYGNDTWKTLAELKADSGE